VIIVLFVLYRNMLFSFDIRRLPLVVMLYFAAVIWTCGRIGRINKQFVRRVHQQRAQLPEFDQINMTKKLLNVK